MTVKQGTKVTFLSARVVAFSRSRSRQSSSACSGGVLIIRRRALKVSPPAVSTCQPSPSKNTRDPRFSLYDKPLTQKLAKGVHAHREYIAGVAAGRFFEAIRKERMKPF